MTLLIILNLLNTLSFAEVSPVPLYTLPKTCNDLLPNMGEYIDFMESVGNTLISKNSEQARKVYDALAIRKWYQETTRDDINPIDGMIKGFLCDCYFENDDKVYKADSSTIRQCLQKSVKKLIKDSTDKYVDLRVKIYDQEKLDKMSEAMRYKIEKMKVAQMLTTKKQLDYEFYKRLRNRNKPAKTN